MQRAFLLFTGFFLLVEAVSGQSAWQDELRRYGQPLSVGAPQGYQIVPRPGATTAGRNISEAAELLLVGFVEKGGGRYYLTKQAEDQFFDSGKEPSWVVITGGGKFPPRPPLLSQGMGTDPDTGEEATIEVYEETVAVQNAVDWPMPMSDTVDVVFPVKVKSASDLGDGKWRAVFTVYPNFDSNIAKLGFAAPAFNQLGNPEGQIRRLLISKPSLREVVVTGSAQGKRIVPVLKPGVLFNGSFRDGRLFRLKAGDIWPAVVASSRFSAPQFRRVLGQIEFRLLATTLDGGQIPLTFIPDRILGADFTDYNMIAEMGPPFDDQLSFPEWTMSEWSVVVRSDQTIRMVAPLMEGRGAAGMLELESLDLGPTYEEEIELMKTFYERQPTPADEEGWHSILQQKLGEIPDSMRISQEEIESQMIGF